MTGAPFRKITGGQAIGLAIFATASPSAANAQQEARGTVEEIVVTGSRIPRRDFNSPSPITTVDNVELRLGGITNVEDTLNTLPQVVPEFTRAANNPGNGTANVNLRGLGANRSLVLLNGKRFISASSDGAIDLNNIPSALIQRIEIVSGGASAVYGSDALTGAINFITRNDFEGIEFNSQFDVTERGDGEVLDVNVAGGLRFADDRGYVSGFVNFHDRSSIFYSDRAFSAQTIQDDIFTGETFASGSSAIPAGNINNATVFQGTPIEDGITFEADGTPRAFVDPDDRFNFAPFNYLQTPLERKVAAALFEFDLTPSSRLYGDFMYVDARQASEFAPSANFFAFVQMNVDNPFVTPEVGQVFAENDFDSDGDGIAEFVFSKRLPELGSRNVERNTELTRLVAGFDTLLPNDWSFDLHVIDTMSDVITWHSNDGSRSRFLQSLLVDPDTNECFDPSGGCQPANIFGENSISPEAADFIRAPAFAFNTDVSQTLVGSSIVGDLWSLPAGEVGFALGLEYREDEYEELPDPDVDNDDQMGLFLDVPVVGTARLNEAFAEVRLPVLSELPLIRSLEFEGGYRWSDHSIAGSYDTWKLSMQWQMFESLTLRGSMQQAVRAPNPLEYFEAETSFIDVFVAEFADLCSASVDPVGLGISDLCVSQGIPTAQIGVYEATPFFPTLSITSGNLDLEPEVSDTVTAGLVFQPVSVPELELSIDYYSIDIDNAIQFIDPFAGVILCFSLNDPTHPVCQQIQRDPQSLNISEIRGTSLNIAKLRTEGYDLQVVYTHDLPGWLAMSEPASLRWWFLGTHTLENGAQLSPDAEFRDCAGLLGFPCDITSFGTLPEYKTKTRVTYESGPLALSLQWRWIDGMRFAFWEYGLADFGIPEEATNFFSEGPGSKSYFALSFDWQVSDSIELYGGIDNLTDTQPPLLAGGANQANTDPTVYDVYGRRYYLGLTARFLD